MCAASRTLADKLQVINRFRTLPVLDVCALKMKNPRACLLKIGERNFVYTSQVSKPTFNELRKRPLRTDSLRWHVTPYGTYTLCTYTLTLSGAAAGEPGLILARTDSLDAASLHLKLSNNWNCKTNGCRVYLSWAHCGRYIDARTHAEDAMVEDST